MATPDYQSIMLPVLEFAKDANEHSMQESIVHVIKHFSVPFPEQLESCEREAASDRNRTGWAITLPKKGRIA